MSEIVGIIDRDWADGISSQAFNIWSFNGLNAEDLQRDIELRMLGGLAVSFPLREPVPIEERGQIRQRRSIIDLAFTEDGFGTSTSLLLRAADESYGTRNPLSQTLNERMKPTSTHGPNETWFVPTRAVRLVEASRL